MDFQDLCTHFFYKVKDNRLYTFFVLFSALVLPNFTHDFLSYSSYIVLFLLFFLHFFHINPLTFRIK